MSNNRYYHEGMHADDVPEAPSPELDKSKRYTCPELKGFAVVLKGWELTYEPVSSLHFDGEGNEYEVQDPSEGEWNEDPSTGRVRVVCVGDNRVHLVEYSTLTALEDRDYCHVCGQVGCKHDGRDDDPDPGLGQLPKSGTKLDILLAPAKTLLKRATAEHYRTQAEQAQAEETTS